MVRAREVGTGGANDAGRVVDVLFVRQAFMSHQTRQRSRWVVAACITASLAGAPAANAAFPGRNGEIAFVAGTPQVVFWPGVLTPGVGGINAVQPDGTDQRAIKVGYDSQVGYEYFGSPAWSPDGTKIAYYHTTDADPNLIEVMNPDGSDSRLLMSSPDVIDWPRWSPDGSMLALQDHNAITIMDHAGRRLFQLVDGGSDVTWSPDCARVAFSLQGDDGIWTLASNGKVHPLTERGYAPDWSPDGRTLVFSSWTIDSGQVYEAVYAVNANGTGERGLRRGSGPAWSPDGRKIVFTNKFGGLSVMNPDGTASRAVTTPPVGGYHGAADWQPLPSAPLDPGLCDTWRTFEKLPNLHLSAQPRQTRAGQLTRFRFKVTRPTGRPLRSAVVHLDGRQARTNAQGVATITHRFGEHGQYPALATKSGFRHDIVTVQVASR